MNAQHFSRRLSRIAAAAAVVAGLLGAVAATPPAPVGAQSCQLDVTGRWSTGQRNGYHVTFDFVQRGTSVSGTASIPGDEQARAGYASPTGSVTGTIVGNELNLVVTWSHPRGPVRGAYRGWVNGTSLDGWAYDLAAPSTSAALWSGSGSPRCR